MNLHASFGICPVKADWGKHYYPGKLALKVPNVYSLDSSTICELRQERHRCAASGIRAMSTEEGAEISRSILTMLFVAHYSFIRGAAGGSFVRLLRAQDDIRMGYDFFSTTST
jgi:hypothetical protein